MTVLSNSRNQIQIYALKIFNCIFDVIVEFTDVNVCFMFKFLPTLNTLKKVLFIMKKWFFYDDVDVYGPFSLKESKELILNKPNLYAWHPSYTHWVPVSCINELDLSAMPPSPPIDIPLAKHADLIGEEQQLISTLERIDKTIKITADSLYEIDTDIGTYNETTKNLSEQVKVTVKSIAEQYASLQKNLANVIKTDY